MAPLELRAGDRYRLEQRLSGSHPGGVYRATDTKTGQELALKLERNNGDYALLEKEMEVYKQLESEIGFPHVEELFEDCDFWVLVLELLGADLQSLLEYCDTPFSLKTVLMLADQLITRLEVLHNKGYVHCDIKPENLLMGRLGKSKNTCFLVDMGLAGECDHVNMSMVDIKERVARGDVKDAKLFGTLDFASLRGHLGINQAQDRPDDLESLGYVLIYLLKGTLPWQELPSQHGNAEMDRQVLHMKANTPIAAHFYDAKIYKEAPELCKDRVDLNAVILAFESYFEHLYTLEPNTVPSYDHLRNIFKALFISQGLEYDDLFDWTVVEYIQQLGRSSG